MLNKIVVSTLTVAIASLALPTFAFPLNESDLAFCKQERDNYASTSIYNSQSSSSQQRSGGARVSVFGVSFGGSGSGSSRSESSTNSQNEVSWDYQARNCDKLLEMRGLVSIAQIEANRDQAIAQMQQESSMHHDNTWFKVTKNTNKSNLIGIGINAGTQLLGNLLNPPSRQAEVTSTAEVKKAEILAQMEIEKERLRLEQTKLTATGAPANVALIFAQWGVSQVACVSGVVFIAGLSSDNNFVCIYPNNLIPPGYYTYNSTANQLIPIASVPTSLPVVAPSRPTVVPVTTPLPTVVPQTSSQLSY
jgi:hypothetical protein